MGMTDVQTIERPILGDATPAVEPPPLPLGADPLLRAALLVQAAIAIPLMVVSIPLSGLNPGAWVFILPSLAFVVLTLRVAKNPARSRAVKWLRRFEKAWIFHAVANLLLALFSAGMWLNPTQILTGFVLPIWILRMTKEYRRVVSH